MVEILSARNREIKLFWLCLQRWVGLQQSNVNLFKYQSKHIHPVHHDYVCSSRQLTYNSELQCVNGTMWKLTYSWLYFHSDQDSFQTSEWIWSCSSLTVKIQGGRRRKDKKKGGREISYVVSITLVHRSSERFICGNIKAKILEIRVNSSSRAHSSKVWGLMFWATSFWKAYMSKLRAIMQWIYFQK